jgi:hypothetical protein
LFLGAQKSNVFNLLISFKTNNFFHQTVVLGIILYDETIKDLWAKVNVIPEVNKIAVFSKGTPKGFKGWIPNGGQTKPIAMLGDKLE